MKSSNSKIKIIWLFSMLLFAICIVVVGGLTRITQSGLSMTNWNVITGSLPPLSLWAWQSSFQAYLSSPEGRLVNSGITLAQYQAIFWMEYLHRMLGRWLWLLATLPFVFFTIKKVLSKTEWWYYGSFIVLISVQGLMGWYMVKSGLVDVPRVSHFRLAIHFWLALLLIAIIFVRLLYLMDSKIAKSKFYFKAFIHELVRKHYVLVLILLIQSLQILYGNFMAGLDAGLISNTYPLMFGSFIPSSAQLFSLEGGFMVNAVSSPVFIHFFHRHLGMVLCLLVIAYYIKMRFFASQPRHPQHNLSLNLYVGIIVFQVFLGIGLIFSNVGKVSALLHQFSTLLSVFALLYLIYVHSVSAFVAKKTT